MKPIFEFQNKIICGNSLDVLREMPDESIDAVITSPPYNCGVNYGSNFDDKKEWAIYWSEMDRIIHEIYRVLKIGGRVCWNIQMNIRRKHEITRTNLMQHFKNLFDKNKFLDMGDILWLEETLTKRTAWGSFASPSAPYIQNPIEFILIHAKASTHKEGKKEDIDISKKEFMDWVMGIWRFHGENKPLTPAAFPPELPKRCMKLFTYRNDLICDPFCGSGTTCMVAKKLGRNYIGIDISEKYYKMAEQRILENCPPTLFEKA